MGYQIQYATPSLAKLISMLAALEYWVKRNKWPTAEEHEEVMRKMCQYCHDYNKEQYGAEEPE